MPRARGAVPRPTTEAAARVRDERLATRATAVVTVTTLFVLGPLLLLDNHFVRGTRYWDSYSLGFVATRDPLWFLALVALLVAPICWWVWRRSGVAALRVTGVVLAGAGAMAVFFASVGNRLPAPEGDWWISWDCAVSRPIEGGSYPLLGIAGLIYVFAFALAPDAPERGPRVPLRERLRRLADDPDEGAAPPPLRRVAPAFAATWHPRWAKERGAERFKRSIVAMAAGVIVLAALAAADTSLVYRSGASGSPTLVGLVASDPAWTGGILGLALAPVLFVAWQFARTGLGRVAGVLLTLGSGLGLFVNLVDGYVDRARDVQEIAWLVPLAAASMTAAFALAPEPRVRETAEEAQARELLRRMRREQAAATAPPLPVPRRPRRPRHVVDPTYVARGPRPWANALLRARAAREARAWWATAFAGVGVVFGLIPLWFLRTPVGAAPGWEPDWGLLRAANADATWGLAAFVTTFAPFWYGVWRTTRVPFGGLIGAACACGGALATALAVNDGGLRACGFSRANDAGVALLLATATVLAAAFVLAPEPAGTDDADSTPVDRARPAARADDDAERRCWSYLLAGAAAAALVALAWSDLPVADIPTCGCGRTETFTLAGLFGSAPPLTEARPWCTPYEGAVVSLAFALVLLAVWQRTCLPLGRFFGVVTSLSSAACVWLTMAPRLEYLRARPRDGAWILLAIAAATALAFAVAPRPRDRSLPDAEETRRLLRRHRAQLAPR